MSNETVTLHKMAESATTTLFLFQNATLAGQAHEHLFWKMAEEWRLRKPTCGVLSIAKMRQTPDMQRSGKI
jgi:hypothetical protein